MSDNSTRNKLDSRTTLKRLGAGLTAGSLLTTSAVGTGTATDDASAVQPAQDLPVIQPGDDVTFDNMTEGWSEEEGTDDDLLIENDQTARTATDRATLWTDAGRLSNGELQQRAVIGKAFEVDTDEQVTLTVDFEGSYNGVVDVDGSSTVNVIGEVGVGPIRSRLSRSS